MEDRVGLAATEDIADVGGPGDMVGIVEVGDQVGMADITVATEGIIAGVVDIVGIAAMVDIVGIAAMADIVGIMGGMVDIMVAAVSTEDPASTSADTLGPPTTIPTGIILPPIIIRINRMLLVYIFFRPIFYATCRLPLIGS